MLYTYLYMKLIFCLGNPEQQYDGTRHNVGFLVANELAEEWGIEFKPSAKFKALIAEHTATDQKVLVVKPTTYYNLVGESARAVMDFYKINPADIIIVHDDLALPLGTIRTRVGGSDAGNNGLKSLEQHVGSNTARIRIGTWHEHHQAQDKVSTVLGKFTKDEQAVLTNSLPIIRRLVASFIHGTFEQTTHRAESE